MNNYLDSTVWVTIIGSLLSCWPCLNILTLFSYFFSSDIYEPYEEDEDIDRETEQEIEDALSNYISQMSQSGQLSEKGQWKHLIILLLLINELNNNPVKLKSLHNSI